MAEFEKNKPFTLLELVVSPTVMNGLKSMKQAMKQVTKAEMKRLSATTTDDQICFLGAIDRRRRSSGVALKDDEIIGPHRQTEDTFQYHEPSSPSLELLEPWQRAKELRVIDGVEDGGLAFHGFTFDALVVFRTVLDRSQR